MKLKIFYVRAAAAAAAALLFLYPFPAHAADSAALQGQVSAAQREYESAASTLDSMQQQASDTRQQVNDFMFSIMQAEPLDASLLQYDDYEGW